VLLHIGRTPIREEQPDPAALGTAVNAEFKASEETTLRKYYHPEDILTLTGRAGFGFVEDSFGFHRGIAPTRRARKAIHSALA